MKTPMNEAAQAPDCAAVPLQSMLATIKEARHQAATAKSLAHFGQEEAFRAKESAERATAGESKWTVTTPGFRGALELIGMAEACMTTAYNRARNAEKHAKDAYQALAVLESSLYKLQQEVQDLAQAPSC